MLGFEKKFDIVVVWLRVEEFSDATGDSCCRIRVFFIRVVDCLTLWEVES